MAEAVAGTLNSRTPTNVCHSYDSGENLSLEESRGTSSLEIL